MPSEIVEVEGELIVPFDTEKAYHFTPDGEIKSWLPKSLVDWQPSPRKDYPHLGTMVLPRWLAEQEGLV